MTNLTGNDDTLKFQNMENFDLTSFALGFFVCWIVLSVLAFIAIMPVRPTNKSGEPLRQEKLKSTDLAPFLEGDIKVKFRRGQDEYIGQLTECKKSSITLENVKGRYASRAEYHVWNEEEFWPMLRDMDDMSAGEIEEADAFNRLPGIVTREAHRIKWYCKHGIDCFGWIEEGLAIRVEYRYLKAGEIIEDGDEVEMSNTIHDPATWVPAANTVGQEAADPAYVSHRKYRRLV